MAVTQKALPLTEEPLDSEFLDGVLQKNEYDTENVIMILQDITARYNYLPEVTLTYVARKLNIPISHIFSVATFYKAFSLTPRGKYIINVCTGTACHVRGAEKIKETIEGRLHIHEGETTEDLMFTLDTVRCLGCCALGPVITVNEKSHGGLDRKKTASLIEQYEKDS
ncbi:MAG: NAD(P)H-dependent oxidoreductase subunit E [Deltaproteobacteria bacterium]|jgi:NADH:ubiquinone oxidoreductase subunit E|nr:NAD(P)H-dependent oxidoreductase subunit E [Deltaproteobacteria bacterium]PNV84670.1 MAG: NAD(P)H-dependent oxidoreductase subunit E [Desulfobacteraceae bacterium]MDH3772734.1 NAD(P)H-dependent oxidoreductase subunit E [Deltaproteobacteria bacterium]MDH3800511.1 NAD(P)H-dependent oxidoreductase subunit E [Deltaproteobacteria bacterium]MDH3851963.1 NAD(P)H-dependent oxidoreductase subunit E [Deltaproteobacteria bacterium]